MPLSDPTIFLGALDRQVGGDHYKNGAIQPVEFIEPNHIPYCMANAIKYLWRHAEKNGRQDLEKALHYIELAAGFYQVYGNPFDTKKEWVVSPEDFIASNNILGQERDAIRGLCGVAHYGIDGYITAHKCVQFLIDHQYPKV